MKLDRRTFLTVSTTGALGGAVGSLFTPIPWKLTDDLSIWTQNWSWTPVPMKGEVSFKDTTCTLCPGGCGVTVRKIDNRMVKVEGKEEHPVNNGGICPLGAAALQYMYGPARVTRPMARTGKRGDGKFEPITWEEAINRVNAKLVELRERRIPNTLGCFLPSHQGTVPGMFKRFMQAYGTPNVFTSATSWDTYSQTLGLMQGTKAPVSLDVENADYILSFGSGLLEGWGSPVRMIQVNSHWKEQGAKVVQADVRLSNTAAKADEFVAVKPGTMGALALGIANVLIEDDKFNRRFCGWFSRGFENYTDEDGTLRKGFKQIVLNDYTPQAVEKITGVPAATITKIAKDMGKASKPLALCGLDQGNTPGSLQDFLAVHALNAMLGRVNQVGGVSAREADPEFDWPPVQSDDFSAWGARQPRMDGAGGKKFPLADQMPSRMAEMVLKAPRNKGLNALFVWGADPAYSLPETEKVYEAFEKIGFVVSFSPIMNDTAAMSDLILPDQFFLEKTQDVPTPPGSTRPLIGLTRPVVEAPEGSKNVGDILIELAQAQGGTIGESFPWDSYEEALEQAYGDKYSDMAEEGFWQAQQVSPLQWKQGAFAGNPSKRFEFCPRIVNRHWDEALILDPAYKPVEIPGKPAEYPLEMVTYANLRLFNQDVGDPPFLIKALPDTTLMDNLSVVRVSPKTLQAIGVKEGGKAILATPQGKATVCVSACKGMPEGVVAAPKGLGHIGYDKYLAGKGVNTNSLMQRVADPVTGESAAWGIRASIRPA